MANPREKEIIVEKIDNGQVKVKGKHQAIKPKCDICGEKGELVHEEYTIHGRTFDGMICKAGTGCRAEDKAQKPKVEKPKATQPKGERENLQFTEAQLVAAVKAIAHPASSREISDKLGIKDPDQGRGYIRTRMLALVKDDKIVTSKPSDAKSRCSFLYNVVE
jgi:hypothetical protein